MGDDERDLRLGDEAPPEEPAAGEDICPDCSGDGLLDGAVCPTCDGAGMVIEGIGGG